MPGRDPAELLDRAWAAEPGLELTARGEALDALSALLDAGAVAAPPDRDWPSELAAERAVDAARLMRVDEAGELAQGVLDGAGSSDIARARATEALGRALAYSGSDGALRRAERTLLDAADRYAALGRDDWHAWALFCLGNAVQLQAGELVEACRSMEQALHLLEPTSPRRAPVLDFYADTLIALGEWHRAEEALAESEQLAHAAGSSGSYAAWSRARMASARGDAMATQRYLREAEREAGDWFDTITGTTFLAEAAELLDRVGRADEAATYLARATARDATDPFVRQAQAALAARSGDPIAALEQLESLAGEQLLEKGQRWRHALLLAWATLRVAGDDAGALAARALDLVGTAAVATEADLVTALLAPAEAAGSAAARAMLVGDTDLLIRLFGTPRLVRADGSLVPMPAGRSAELVRLLALHPFGVTVDVVLEQFFPDVAEATARHRLRQMLTKLRATCGDLVRRSDDRLTLAPAWVDLRAFQAAADKVRAARGARAVALAHAAVALWTGPPLPGDEYSPLVEPLLDQLRFRHLDLLDLIAADSERRHSYQEAAGALAAAVAEDPLDEARRARLEAAHEARAYRAPGRRR